MGIKKAKESWKEYKESKTRVKYEDLYEDTNALGKFFITLTLPLFVIYFRMEYVVERGFAIMLLGEKEKDNGKS